MYSRKRKSSVDTKLPRRTGQTKNRQVERIREACIKGNISDIEDLWVSSI